MLLERKDGIHSVERELPCDFVICFFKVVADSTLPHSCVISILAHDSLDYAGPEILSGEKYKGPPQDVWAFGIVSYVLVVGECPFSSAVEASVGLAPGSKALLALEERCGRAPSSGLPSDVSSAMGTPPLLYPAPADFTQLDFSDLFVPVSHHEYDAQRAAAKMEEGREQDDGGRLGDAMAMIKACLQLDVASRPTFDDILASRYLSGRNGWVELGDIPSRVTSPIPVPA